MSSIITNEVGKVIFLCQIDSKEESKKHEPEVQKVSIIHRFFSEGARQRGTIGRDGE